MFSCDGGTSWSLITSAASNSEYLWENIPNINSNSCKIRAVANFERGEELWTSPGLGVVVKWSPDGGRIVTCGGNIITVLDANKLDILMTI